MRIGRTLPPAAAPLNITDLLGGIVGLFRERKFLNKFEHELCRYFDISECFLFSSGRAALAAALLALREMSPQRHEVVLPAYVCYSVPSAVVRAGLKVVLCDLKPRTLEMDLKKLSPLLRKTTLCVIVPHLFGLPAPILDIAKLCREKGIIVIEDSAQAIGTTYDERMLGTQGTIGFFSLGRGKTLSSVEGGILITKDSSIRRVLRARLARLDSYSAMGKAVLLLKAFLLFVFSHPNLHWFPKSLPFLKLGETIYDPDFSLKKMCGIQAGLSRNWEKRLKYFTAQRKKNAQGFLRMLSANSSIFLLTRDNLIPVCLRLPVYIKKIEDKEYILSESEKRGLGIMFTYPDSIDGIPELMNMITPGEYPEARGMAQHVLTLPVHPAVSKHDMDKIITLLGEMDRSASIDSITQQTQ